MMRLVALDGEKPKWLPYWYIRTFGWRVLADVGGRPADEPFAYELFGITYGIPGKYEQHVSKRT